MKENYKGLYSFKLKDELKKEGKVAVKHNIPYERNVEEPSGIVHTELTAKINMEGKAVFIPSVTKDIFFTVKKTNLNEEIIYEQLVEAKKFFLIGDLIYTHLKENNEKIKKAMRAMRNVEKGSDMWLFLNDYKQKKLNRESIFIDLKDKLLGLKDDLDEVIDIFQNFRKGDNL